MKVIGIVNTVTEQVRYTESGKPLRYNLKFVSYDGSMKGKLTPEEKLSVYFKSLSLVFDG